MERAAPQPGRNVFVSGAAGPEKHPINESAALRSQHGAAVGVGRANVTNKCRDEALRNCMPSNACIAHAMLVHMHTTYAPSLAYLFSLEASLSVSALTGLDRIHA